MRFPCTSVEKHGHDDAMWAAVRAGAGNGAMRCGAVGRSGQLQIPIELRVGSSRVGASSSPTFPTPITVSHIMLHFV